MYRAIFDHAPDAMIFLNDQGTILTANASAVRLFEIPLSGLLGAPLHSFESRLLAFDSQAALERFRAEGSLAGSFRLRTGNGALREFEFHVTASIMGEHHLAVCRDVTERMEVERALRLREKQLAQAQAIAQLGHWQWTPGNPAIEVSEEAFRIYGFDPGAVEATTRLFRQALHPDDRQQVRLALWGAVRQRSTFSVDYRIVRRDGQVRTIRQEGDASVGEDGRVRLLGVIRDITEQKQTQEAREKALRELAAERTWLSTLIERSPVAFVLLGEGGRRVVFNRRAQELIGGDGRRLSLQQLLTAVCLPSGAQMAPSQLPSTRALVGEWVLSEEITLRRPDGTLVPALASAGPIEDGEGNRLGAVVVFEDIRALKALDRMREEWTSIVAHDLRQPLTVISAQGQILARKLRQTYPELLGPSEHILASVGLLNRMVGDLLDMSRIEAHRLSLELQPVALEMLARKVIERLSLELQQQEVILDASSSLPMVMVDPIRFEQIFVNLLSNAVKYGERSAAIRVVLRGKAEGLTIEVINEGKGIPQEELANLFTRFHRTEGAKTSSVGGLGLGLYITRGLVEAHGGGISAESSPGGNTVFRISLPHASLHASPHASSTP